MEKVVKYPKYKEQAYLRLDKLFKGVLDECGFYSNQSELRSEGLVFSYKLGENLKGMSVTLRGTTLIRVEGGDIVYSICKNLRLQLTPEEKQAISDDLLILMSVGDSKSVFRYTGKPRSWCISSKECKFIGTWGTYINTKDFRPKPLLPPKHSRK